MPQTPNHGYNVPNKGDANWHQPLNANFRQYDTDIEVRDTAGNRGNYDPKAGAKFYATDTGEVYLGDGSTWNPVASTGPTPTLSALNTGSTDLGVGTGSPGTKLHVTDDPATTGAMDPSRVVAMIENTSGASNGDMLGLKAQVADPGSNVDFLSFIGANAQLGQLSGNGNGGIRLQSTNDLELGSGTNTLITADGGSREVGVRGDLTVAGGLQVLGSTKNFVQAVETDAGPKEVVYTSTEAPTPRTETSGVAQLEDGRCAVDLPEHFGWVTDAEEPIVVQVTPHAAEPVRPQVTDRSTDHMVIRDVEDDAAAYEVSYTVRGTRDGYADEQVVREPTGDPADEVPEAPADD